MPESTDAFEQLRRDIGPSYESLWLRHSSWGLSGMNTACELEAYLHAAPIATTHGRDIIVVALNERCSEFGHDFPAAYFDHQNGPH